MNFTYCLTNLLNSASAPVASSANASYPVANLHNERPGKPFKFAATSGNIVIDHTSAVALTFIALINHNIDTGVTVTLERNATDSWATPSYSEVITWATGNLYEIIATSSYRFSRLTIGVNSANPQIGEFILGSEITLTQNYKWGTEEPHMWDSVQHQTEYGQRWTYELNNNDRSWKLEYTPNATTKAEILALYTASKGGSIPFCWVSHDSAVHYVYASKGYADKRIFTGYSETSGITLTEAPSGKETA